MCGISHSFQCIHGKDFQTYIINMKGVNVGGTNYNNLRYADDIGSIRFNKQNKQSRKTIWNAN